MRERREEGGELGVAEGFAGGGRGTVLQKERAPTGVRAERRSEVADRGGDGGAEREAVAREGDGGLDGVAERARAVAVEGKLKTGQNAGDAGGEPADVVDAAADGALFVEGKQVGAGGGGRGGVGVDGDDIFAVGRCDHDGGTITANTGHRRGADGGGEGGCDHGVDGVAPGREDLGANFVGGRFTADDAVRMGGRGRGAEHAGEREGGGDGAGRSDGEAEGGAAGDGAGHGGIGEGAKREEGPRSKDQGARTKEQGRRRETINRSLRSLFLA